MLDIVFSFVFRLHFSATAEDIFAAAFRRCHDATVARLCHFRLRRYASQLPPLRRHFARPPTLRHDTPRRDAAAFRRRRFIIACALLIFPFQPRRF